VAYTGTHDNDTLRGWWESLDEESRALVQSAVRDAGVEEAEPWWACLRLLFSSRARVAMVQTQDVLGLGSEARMNQPGTTEGSWRWRLRDGALTVDLGRRLRAASEEAGRAA
jgi:4-alpha-glucanotransferase